MQTKLELEQWYQSPDPWGYKANPDDINRRNIIRDFLLKHLPPEGYEKALDIGCGEGFITSILPARLKYGLDLSENALTRLCEGVCPIAEPAGTYDLVISTGTLYVQYNHEHIALLIKKSMSKHVLIGGIKDWLLNYQFGKVIETIEFPYREFTQKLILYEASA